MLGDMENNTNSHEDQKMTNQDLCKMMLANGMRPEMDVVDVEDAAAYVTNVLELSDEDYGDILGMLEMREIEKGKALSLTVEEVAAITVMHLTDTGYFE